MEKRYIRFLAGVGLALWVGGCSSLGAVFNRGGDNGLEQVDGLLGNVERAHLECELSRTQSAAALDALHEIIAPEFRGDAIAAYGELQVQLELSLEQAAALRATIEPMKRAAEKVAANWQADLEAFGSEIMRAKSRERLDETTADFISVHVPLVAASDAYDLFNLGLSDHILYLGHALNTRAVTDIEDELMVLTALQVELDQRLTACMQAAGDYVRGNALRGQLEPLQADASASIAALEPTVSN